MDYSKESIDRQKKIQDMKDAWIICYANNFRWKQDINDIRLSPESDYKEVDFLMENWSSKVFKTAWRLISSRWMGKLTFAKLRDNTWDIQICFMRDKVNFNTGREIVQELEIAWEIKSAYKIAEKFCQVWDYIGVEGELFITKHWELTIFVKEFQVLSKAVRPLPEKFHWVTDQETIYRQRYLDLITNEKSFDRFNFRSNFITLIRSFLNSNWFKELECPIINNAASGAAAKPFITHHNDFDEDYFLRICNEISLKKATVWKFEKVYDMWKCFRNEWSDPSHVQEFTMLEFQACWWSLEDNMEFAEKMMDYIFDELKLDRKIKIKDKEGVEKDIDFTTPWQRVNYTEWLNNASWLDINDYKNWDEKKLIEDIKSKWINFEGIDNMWVTTLIDNLYKKVFRPSIVWPAFVYNYPKLMQPLARQSDENDNIVEQYQVVINGWEVMKCYSELVDPVIMKENFSDQWEALERWDEEATSWDDDFVTSMEYGMPPQSWFGMWIDRIVSLLTWQENLRDVVLFPLMKEEKDETSKGTNLAVCVLNKSIKMEKWQELNTIAHLNAAYWARNGKWLFEFNEVSTKDGKSISMNTTHAIMIKETNNNDDVFSLIDESKKINLHVSEFTREMLETSDDKKVLEDTKTKNLKDVEYFGVLVYGSKKEVEKATKDFSLYS